MNIEDLAKHYKTYEELQLFTASQFKQILSLSKKIKELEEKLANKPSELTTTSTSSSIVSITPDLLLKDDAKIIAQVQIKFLKDKALTGELSLEETKKLEIFNKILNVQEEKPKTIKADAKTLKTNDLLSLIETDNGTEAK